MFFQKKVLFEPSDEDIGVTANSFCAKTNAPAYDEKFRTDCTNFLAATVPKILQRNII